MVKILLSSKCFCWVAEELRSHCDTLQKYISKMISKLASEGDLKPVRSACTNCLPICHVGPSRRYLIVSSEVYFRHTDDVVVSSKKWVAVIWCYDFFITGYSSNTSHLGSDRHEAYVGS